MQAKCRAHRSFGGLCDFGFEKPLLGTKKKESYNDFLPFWVVVGATIVDPSGYFGQHGEKLIVFFHHTIPALTPRNPFH